MAPPLPQLPGVTHRTVDAAGLSVHVAEAGPTDAPPVVLLHGWPQHWWCWRHVVPLLAPTHRLLMPDLRGHGWTDAPRGGYDKEQLATDLLATLDALELDRVGLVGHDWGGWTGFLACLRAPERFAGFLALGITHPWPQLHTQWRHAWRFGYQVALALPVLAEQTLRMNPALVEQSIKLGTTRRDAFTPEDLRCYSEVLAQPAHARASSRLYREFLLHEGAAVARGRYADRRLRVPTVLLTGAGDPVVRPSLTAGWEGHADDMRSEVLPDVGHFVPEEAPRTVAERARALAPAS